MRDVGYSFIDIDGDDHNVVGYNGDGPHWISVANAVLGSCFSGLEFDVNGQLVSLSLFAVQFNENGFWLPIGLQSRRQPLIARCSLALSLSCIISLVAFHTVWAINGDHWSTANSQWAKLIGFVSVQSSTFPYFPCFLVIEVLVATMAVIETHNAGVLELDPLHPSFSQLRALCCLLLPAIQLVVGISHPSWASFPFFIGSCSGLINWSLTSDILGLFRWWRFLLVYAGFNIFLLYVYQLPLELHGSIKSITTFIGLYKFSTQSEWLDICSSLSLILFYIVLSWIRCDLSEMDSIMSSMACSLTEHLLPERHSLFIYASRSGTMHTNVLLRRGVFRTFSVNFFTYGFLISLLALSVWSFHFASFCAFGLLAYVGYILCAFPSLFHLHWLNGLLLVFILFWAASTYVFNVELTILNKKMSKHMQIWEAIGLWYYPIPGFYLLAQFGLGVLVALGNLVNNSVFLYLTDEDRHISNEDFAVEETEETKVLIVATVAWCLRKSSRAIALVLIFLIALKPGCIHALYVVFFLIYLLSHTISKKICQCLIVLCEAHFAMLYILRLDLISKELIKKCSFTKEILSQLGIVAHAGSGGFLKIAALACFCTIHNHGFEMLSSFSEILRHTPQPPIGFSILRAGLIKSVLLSVYTSGSRQGHGIDSSHERRIASYLSAIGKKFLSVYRAYGTYIAVQTILMTVYLVRPNFMSFGYLFFLLIWMIGRQISGRSKRHVWLPLKLYAVSVFVVTYGLSVFVSFRTWLSRMIDITTAFGYNPEASMLMNMWHSLAVLIVMQLYSYERRQSMCLQPYGDRPEENSITFIRRILILHSEKTLNVALFYASLSPISAFGFLYLIGLVVCSSLPKVSWLPSQLFLIYSGFLVILEYLFQLLGDQAEMFPGQNLSSLSYFLGLQLYKPGFFGLESGLRGKVLVIFSCILRYNVYHWLETMPQNSRNGGDWEEPCGLFSSLEEFLSERIITNRGSKPSPDARPDSERQTDSTHLWPSHDPMFSDSRGIDESNSGKYSYICGSLRENKQSRKRIYLLRKERLNLQKSALKVYMKFWIENMFNLFGLEIIMVALLLASFAVLNAVSLLYVASLAACILLQRHIVRNFWPIFVFLFGLILTFEYVATWVSNPSWQHNDLVDPKIPCKECWRSSDLFFNHCEKCWLGIVVDDSRHLISYYIVFMLACFKFRSDQSSTISATKTYQQIKRLYKNALLGNVSFEQKSLWTFLDYLCLYSYCHLLDLVLSLILITGTFEFDILHFGYLGFALLFFRMRLEILKKKNGIFKFLRMYNFAIVFFSLAYQSPFVGGSCGGECGTLSNISQVVGFYKFDYGFRITARSSLVEIIIFILVSLQSFMFSSKEFDYVSECLQAEQIASIVCEQEKRAAWRTEQLQQIRKAEEQKRLRNLQVEKMKSEVLNLQIQLRSKNTLAIYGSFSRCNSLRRPISSSPNTSVINGVLDKVDTDLKKQAICLNSDSVFTPYLSESPGSERSESPYSPNSRKLLVEFDDEIRNMKGRAASDENLDLHSRAKPKLQGMNNPITSAVHLFRDGVSQAHSLGNVAVNNLIHFFNIKSEETDLSEGSGEEEVFYEIDNPNLGCEPMDRALSVQSECEHVNSSGLCQQIGMILRYILAKMRSNNDFVCYCCFILVFLWNFSLLAMVYLIALFVCALLVNPCPNNLFWFGILIYTEICILVQYIYQIVIQHCDFTFDMSWLQELGFPGHEIKSSFVVSNLPLFLVYIFTLIQTTITAKDGDWTAIAKVSSHKRRNNRTEENVKGFIFSIESLFLSSINAIKLVLRSLSRHWKSLTEGSETPPYFVQLSLKVDSWPVQGIQPERIKLGINRLLKIMHDKRCKGKSPDSFHIVSRVHVQSIEASTESTDVALAVFEVVRASPLEDCTHAEFYSSLTPAADVAYEIVEAQVTGVVRESGFPYPILSVIGGRKKELDLYPYIFCSDFVVFLLVAICYQSIMKNNSEIFEVYQLEDQFPKEFVFVLMVIFFLIVLDRIIYLCSFAIGKVIFYFFNFVLFTYSVTKFAWSIESQQRHAGKMALRAIYLAKAISLALQATQMRFGVPRKSMLYRQFLTSQISRLNNWGFRLYRALPFLYELRCVLDWSCTTTSLTMYDWLKLEDIHASLFLVKCDAILNREKHRQGERQSKMTKFCNGICVFFILLCVIWAPMLMYSSGNPTNIANPIKDASIRLDIKTVTGRLTLFETTLCEKIPWTELKMQSDLHPDDSLSAYNEQDIQLICCQPDASSLWLVPPVVQNRFMASLEISMDIVFSWQLTRDRPRGKEVVRYDLVVQQEDLPTYLEVMEVLNGTANSFTIYNIYPRFFRVTGSGEVRLLEPVVDMVSGDLTLNRGSPEWWSFHDIDTPFGCGKFGGPMAIVVSEETPQGIIGDTLSKFSIWGLYITFVLAVGRFIRLQCSDLRMRIPFENLPSCDRLLAICENIYAVRAEGELEVEEVLYLTLVKIYRSSHMLLEYTKPD